MKPFVAISLMSVFLFLNSGCVSTSSNAYSEPSITDMQRTPAEAASALHASNLDTSKNFEIQIVSSLDPLQIVSGYTADTTKLGAVTQVKSATASTGASSDSAQMLIPIYGSHNDFAALGERDQLWCLTKAIQDGLVESIQIEQQGVKNSWGLFRDSFHAENGVKTFVHLSSGVTAVLGDVVHAAADVRTPAAQGSSVGKEQYQPLCSVLKTSSEAARNRSSGGNID